MPDDGRGASLASSLADERSNHGLIVAAVAVWAILCAVILVLPVDWWLPAANTIAVLAILAAALQRYRSWTNWTIATVVCLALARATWTIEPVAVALFACVVFALWVGFGIGVVWLLYLLGKTTFPGQERLALCGRSGQATLGITACVYLVLDCVFGPLLMPFGLVVNDRPSSAVWSLLTVVAFVLLLATTLPRFNRREMNRLSWFPVLMAMLTVLGGRAWWWLLRALE
jgi:hypothetical protein